VLELALIPLGYVVGSLPFGYWLPRLVAGVDIRTVGSGNTGATNVWLALDVDSYGILDGWILTALVLWAIAGGAGIRLGLAYSESEEPPSGSVVPVYAVMAVAVTALLVVMIYKPGA